MAETWFAPAERSDREELERELARVSVNPVMDAVLKSVGGLVAILNRRRQIIAVNDVFLRELGGEDPASVFGLRLGEAIGCVHADGKPAGCGTTRYCRTCGAAIAIVTSLAEDGPVTEICCASTRDRDGHHRDLFFQVRAVPFACDDERFLFLFLRDMTREQDLLVSERVFFHDINNLLAMLQGTADLMAYGSREMQSTGGRFIGKLVRHLSTEIELQKALVLEGDFQYRPRREEVSVPGLLVELREEFQAHPAARGRKMVIDSGRHPWRMVTDRGVLFRVLRNMVVNGFEAAEEGDEVRVTAEPVGPDKVCFTVWNRAVIPEDIQLRIFQRNFSTKKQQGRGLGTWSMKYFGEKLLGGEVGFSSTPENGTEFFLILSGTAAASPDTDTGPAEAAGERS